MNIFESEHPFVTESGETIAGLKIAYHTFGSINEDASNVIWVCHALTANSDVADWWPHTVESGCFLDPEKYFVVCANILGSCYGTSGPLSVNPASGEPWYDTFPNLTIRDIVNAHILLAEHLKIKNIASLIGSSVGGFQAVEWAVMQPDRFDSVVLIATDAYASPWSIAVNETQRMAILSDSTYGEKRKDAASAGLAAARAIGMLTYRGPSGYNLSQKDEPMTDSNLWALKKAMTYQRHQGNKLVNRFDAYSYMSILNSFDTHNVGRGRGGISKALSALKMPVLVVGITSDIIFTPDEMRNLASSISNSNYEEIDSAFGHDGFLVEHEALNKIVNTFFKKNKIACTL